MSFSTPIFLYLFFPLTLLGYYLIHPQLKNAFLMLASLAFYYWCEPTFIIIFAVYILWNYFSGLILGKLKDLKYSKRMVIVVSLVGNIISLLYYKYLTFGTEIINDIFKAGLPIKEIALPIGISFFTFRSISYIFDVYWGDTEVQKNPINVGLYISFFPQVTMGPITKSCDFLPQLKERRFNLDKFADGVKRFTVGMAKKLIIADTLAVIVNPVFAMAADERTVIAAWYGIIGYCLQLYYDFSGYSDMAIGLSAMFGFETPENFDYPYMSTSIADFWRRWHITLGDFFKKYVYFPLGGSRKGNVYFNIFVVFLLTGIWHGAAWTFIIWGLWHGLFRLIEMYAKKHFKNTKIPGFFKHLYALVVIGIGWVFFRAENLSQAWKYLGTMVGISGAGLTDSLSNFNAKSYLGLMLVGILFCFPVVGKIKELLHKNKVAAFIADYIAQPVIYIALLLVCVSSMLVSSYDPFLYQNF